LFYNAGHSGFIVYLFNYKILKSIYSKASF